MKFTTAWAEIASQNLTLKVAVAFLSIATVFLTLTTARLSLKDPLIIERSCFSKIITQGSNERSQQEITGFINEALSARFDSDVALNSSFLSQEELGFRALEQKELSQKNMTQKIIVESIKINGNNVSILADRFITVGSIRSVLPFPLTATIAITDRSAGNPYGLILVKVSSAASSSANNSGSDVSTPAKTDGSNESK